MVAGNKARAIQQPQASSDLEPISNVESSVARLAHLAHLMESFLAYQSLPAVVMAPSQATSQLFPGTTHPVQAGVATPQL